MKARLSIRNRTLFVGDLFLIVAAVLGSFVLRVPLGLRLLDFLPQILVMIGVAWVVKPLVYYQFGLYRRLWAYASVQELKLIVAAVTAASIPVGVVVALLSLTIFKEFPRSVPIIDWLLSLLSVGGLRFSLRVLAESQARPLSAGRSRRVLVVGAGDAGALVVREMQKNPLAGLTPVCFVDDDPDKHKQEIHGVPVVGRLDDLPHIANVYHADEVIIAIPSAPGRVIRLVTDICRQNGVPFRTMPGLHELIGGKVSVSRLREVDITDLLRREPADIDDKLVGASLNGRQVLVTGAGGSIGRELCRQAARWEPAELILLGHGENSIFEISIELGELYPSLPIRPIIADVRDQPRLQTIFAACQPQVVFHAAAHKHVTLMETNIEEAVTNNVLGTRNVVETAREQGVERLVMISTDKAIRPSSVMGATKRLAEMLVLDAATRSGRAFSVVRFGNVLGSRGSVIQLFKRQIALGGPVTITHPDMQRYFMTIPEAVHLVLQASAMGQGGEVFVLNMGEQVRILDLAEDLIRLSGLEPHKDIEIVYTGPRPGEKLSEVLWDEGDDYQRTTHPDVLRLGNDDRLTGERLQLAVNNLGQLAVSADAEAIIAALNQHVPSAAVRLAPSPDLTALV
jgi:FlaA1/EpsC-like NDP-sugar epimerase